MTDNNHPITPPPELVQQWESTAYDAAPVPYTHHIARCAARWGADQELKACCLWADITGWKGARKSLQLVRRPKPPSLKEQALAELELLRGDANAHGLGFDAPVIRRALESLPGLANITSMSELSPAAKAVLDATNQAYDQAATVAQGTAAALHELARQVVPDDLELSKRSGEAVRLNRLSICRQIHAIADELEAQ